MPRRLVFQAVATIVLVFAPLARAAAPDAGPPDAKTLAYLQRLFSKGRLARVQGVEGERVVAGPAFLSEGMRDVDSSGVVTLTSWSQIERIDARAGSPSRGAAVGAVIGAGTGVVLGIALAQGEGGGGWTVLIGSTALFAATGALVGATVGSLFPGWQKVYPGKASYGSSWGLEKK